MCVREKTLPASSLLATTTPDYSPLKECWIALGVLLGFSEPGLPV